MREGEKREREREREGEMNFVQLREFVDGAEGGWERKKEF